MNFFSAAFLAKVVFIDSTYQYEIEMKNIRNGRWKIESVIINSSTVMNYEGFEYFEVNDEHSRIQPIGISFVEIESDELGAVLKSGDTTYFIATEVNGDELTMQMSRPNYGDVFEITAMLEPTPVSV